MFKLSTRASSAWVCTLLAVSVLGVGACRNPIKDLKGTYLGDVSMIENGTVRNARVKTVITDQNKHGSELTFDVDDEASGQALASIHLKKKSGGKIVLQSSYLPGSSSVELQDKGACAARADVDQHGTLVTFCATGEVISLFAADRDGGNRFFLYLSKNDSNTPDSVVTNGVWGLQDLYRRVQNNSYDTRLGAERLYQAHEEIKLARAKLVPGLSVGTVLSAVDVFSGVGVVSLITTVVSNLMPFIFPSGWYELDKSKAMYQSEVFSYRALVANQMNLVEGLYYSILRDQVYLSHLEGFTSFLERYYDEMRVREQMGLVKPGTSLAFRNFIIQNENDKAVLRSLLRVQYASLSRGIGLSPRDGVVRLADSQPPQIQDAQKLSFGDLAPRVLSASLELKQIYYMERAAQILKNEAAWSFINPSQWVGFNASIFHEVHLAKAHVHEAEIMRQNSEDQIQESVVSVVEEHNLLLDRSALMSEAIDNTQQVLQRIDVDLAAGVTVDVNELRSTVSSLLGFQALKASIDAAYAVSVGKVNRMTLQGPYMDVVTLEPVPAAP
jgi:hypothetical protein